MKAQLNIKEAQQLRSWTINLNNDVADFTRDFTGLRPQVLSDFFKEVTGLSNQLQSLRQFEGRDITILIAAIVHFDDSARAADLRESLKTATDALAEQLHPELTHLQKFKRKPWFNPDLAMVVPKIDDFIIPDTPAQVRRKRYRRLFSDIANNGWTRPIVIAVGTVALSILFKKC
jgi:hypothetical protein